MNDVLHLRAENVGTMQGYAHTGVTLTVVGKVAPQSAPPPQEVGQSSADVEAFGRMLAGADMADRGLFGTDITHMTDEEYFQHLLG